MMNITMDKAICIINIFVNRRNKGEECISQRGGRFKHEELSGPNCVLIRMDKNKNKKNSFHLISYL